MQLSESEQFTIDLENLKLIEHDNIAEMSEFYEDFRFFYIVTDVCGGKPIFNCVAEMDSFSEKDAAIIIQ